MGMEISYRLNVSGQAPSRETLLPELPGATSYEPGFIDRMGEQVQSSAPLIAAGSIGGGIIGTKLLRMGGGGIFRGIVGGIAGVLAGAAITTSGLALGRGIGDHRAPAAPKDAHVASTNVAAREKVKVMTYNLHGGMGGTGEFGSNDTELDELAEAIRREQPDVLLLQEVDKFATRSSHKDVLAELDKRLDADSAVTATAMTQVTGRNQDVGVMTFHGFRIADARNIVHPDERGGGFDMRARSFYRDAKTAVGHVLGKDWSQGTQLAIRNTVDTIVTTPGGTDVRVLTGHYEWPSAEADHQARQVGAVAGALDAWKGPTIWSGDFNVRSGSPWGASERRIMAAAGLKDTFGDTPQAEQVSMTWLTNNPNEREMAGGGIDRIYASEHAKVLGAHVVREAGDASDHLPVVAELELQP
ncbi:MAG: endonuclease [Thermoleophilia bacterium]|nr:endonuclease [Thermoleophilia bacterium]